VRIRINIQIFAAIAIFILTNQIEIYAWLMLFALVHELAHMCTGLLLKLPPKTLEIQPFGVGIIFENFENTEKNKIIIAMAGPLINIIIAIIGNFINLEFKTMIVNSNILLAIFNLIPIYPLDGGRILKSIIRMNNDKWKTEDIINKISNILMVTISVISSFMILIYQNLGLFIIIVYLWIIVAKENKRYMLKKRINKLLEKSKNT